MAAFVLGNLYEFVGKRRLRKLGVIGGFRNGFGLGSDVLEKL